MKLAVSLFAVAASTGLASAQLTVTATPAQAWSVAEVLRVVCLARAG